MLTRSLTKSSMIAAAAVALLALSACGGSDALGADPSGDATTDSGGETTAVEQPTDEAEDDAGEQPEGAGDGKGEAVLTIKDIPYTAALEMCMLQEGGDALFHGTARDSSGQDVGYLDGDFTSLGDLPHGEVRINFGATGKFESSDEFVSLGDALGHIVVTDSSNTSLMVMGSAWDNDGTDLSTGSLSVNCG